MRANRAFLARVIRYLAGERSVGQFLDIGTGLRQEPGGNADAGQSLGQRERIGRRLALP